VGLLSYHADAAYEGYNLVFPHNQSTVFLFNNCGEIVHTWEDSTDYVPGNAAYLLENGNLIKCKRHKFSAVGDPIWAGGGGETVEIRDWDNNLLHSFTLNDSLYRLHHDVAPLPNGNILMVVWEKKTYAEAVEAGRDTALLDQDELWSEAVLEWNPELDSIVWSWQVWDHLIQEHDPNAKNFGNVANHPELIHVNYDEHDGHPDWLHINSIDYNPVLDQFVLSVPYFNEFWIVDHSITREEAKGVAGDLLYRWGNPAAYDQGDVEDKKLFFQHDVHWVDAQAEAGTPDFGHIALFNNRVTPSRSTANIIDTQVDAISKTYAIADNVFAPTDFQQTIVHPSNAMKAFSNAVSSVQQLPNGNFLICAGRWGYAYELTPEQEIVWEYVVPLKAGNPVEQGQELDINNNLTFRVKRFGVDYPAFAEKELSPQGYIELNPDERFCEMVTSTHTVEADRTLNVYPNPATTFLTIENFGSEPMHLKVFDLYGRLQQEQLLNKTTILNVKDWSPGVYFLQTGHTKIRKIIIQK